MSDLWHHLGFKNDKSILRWALSDLSGDTSVDPEDRLWIMFDEMARERGVLVYAIVGDPDYVNYSGQTNSTSNLDKREALGTIGYLDIETKHRSLGTGAVLFGGALRESAAATEAHYLLLKNVFEPADGPAYRRVQWKNNVLNTASRKAAQRIGYSHEGVLRNHFIVKGRNRDSDVLSLLEDEWPRTKLALEKWLDAGNFDTIGKQIESLDIIKERLFQ